MFDPATIHPDLVKVGPGHDLMGVVHFEEVPTRAPEPCAACNGTGRDHANKRKHCTKCRNRKVQTPAESNAIREGYSFSVIGNARDFRDAANLMVGPLGFDHRTKPDQFVYYIGVEEQAFDLDLPIAEQL